MTPNAAPLEPAAPPEANAGEVARPSPSEPIAARSPMPSDARLARMNCTRARRLGWRGKPVAPWVLETEATIRAYEHGRQLRAAAERLHLWRPGCGVRVLQETRRWARAEAVAAVAERYPAAPWRRSGDAGRPAAAPVARPAAPDASRAVAMAS